MRGRVTPIGIGWRAPLAAWIESHPPEVGCLEVTAEHFFDGGEERLRSLSLRYPLLVHGLGLSLGTPGPLDRATLERFARVVEAAAPLYVSEHVAFTRTREGDLGHLNPVRPTRENLRILAEHAREVAERCRRPLLLENIATHLRPTGDMEETDFLNRLCEEAECGLLLDVTNLYVNARNHRFDPLEWLRAIDPTRIVQLHIVGYSVRGARWHDLHAEAVQEELFDLAREALALAPVRAVILERDGNFPAPAALARELRELEVALG